MSARMPYRIALTGGPSAGKSTLQRAVEQTNPVVYSVPEVATLLLSGGFPAPTDEHPWTIDWQRNLQRAVAATQLALEDISLVRAASDSKPVILYDRGVPDGAAYLPGGISELEALTGETERTMLGRYDLVLHLSSSALHGAYDKASNQHRFEAADAALELEQRTLDAWANHPNRIILNDPDKARRTAQGLAIIAGVTK